jgi:hypothetical protein
MSSGVKEVVINVAEYVLRDADGARLRPWDDVVLLDDTPVTGKGTHPEPVPNIVCSGTLGTLLFLADEERRVIEIECYPSPNTLLFAEAPASRVRLFQTREAKSKAART